MLKLKQAYILSSFDFRFLVKKFIPEAYDELESLLWSPEESGRLNDADAYERMENLPLGDDQPFPEQTEWLGDNEGMGEYIQILLHILASRGKIPFGKYVIK